MNSKLAWAIALLVQGCFLSAQAQLAITEVMTRASLEDTAQTNRRPDFWELTNFGTNAISLDGYSFNDKKRKTKPNVTALRGLTIQGGESIVFFRVQDDPSELSTITNVTRFQQWWGTNLSTNVQIRIYKSPGLNGEFGDEVWVYDRQTNEVDSVILGEARVGRSSTCERNTGIFGVLSAAGVDGAFAAAEGDDVGSPGTAIGPFPLDIARQPSDLTADAGSDATFSVVATGLPRPKYQWLFNGEIIPGATSATLTLANLQPEDTGEYSVHIRNGLEDRVSDAATLRVEIVPNAPIVMQAPSDLTLYPNQTAIFSVLARGYPALSYQWQSNGLDLAGAATHTLVVSNAALGMSDTLYTVHIWNDWGTTNLSVVLRVLPKPVLRFTEMMGNPLFGDSSSHFDWFELTNGGTNTVDLLGYRFFDSLTFEGAWTIPGHLYIRPGESMVFVEAMSPESFWKWWGVENGQMGIQVYTYHGFSLGNLKGDIYLWNGASINALDMVSGANWASLTIGASQECENFENDSGGCDGYCFMDSVVGLNGAYKAAVNGDIGSPGFTTNPLPRILSTSYDGETVNLKCRVIPGKTYRLKAANALGTNSWTEVGTYPATGYLLRIEYAEVSGEPARFYLLEEID